jgi:glucuronoxylan 4-O-methyltransferase
VNFKNLIVDLKSSGKGLMSEAQYMNVGYVVDILSPCNFLIFGLGEDASVWSKINQGGRTVFLEDDKAWIEKFEDRGLEIYDVHYDSQSQNHELFGFDETKLKMDLPKEVANTKWDVVFVDGPLGHNPPRPFKGPGRMKSIYAAYTLLKENGICVVDDLGRLIEKKYSFHFFGEHNLYNVIEDKVGIFKKRTSKE